VLQGGFSTGAGHRDLCDVWAALPELVNPPAPAVPTQVNACKIDEEWQMNWRGLVTCCLSRAFQRHDCDVPPEAISAALPPRIRSGDLVKVVVE